jgi:branched-chain amino acid aminotransferase
VFPFVPGFLIPESGYPSSGEELAMKVWIDGQLIDRGAAKVSVYDHGLLYGDGVFEGIRSYSGRVFRLKEHVDRLYDSAQIIGLRIPLTKVEMKEVILEVVRRSQLTDAHIRPLITRGEGTVGVDPRGDLTATVIVMAYPWPPFLGGQGITMKTVSTRRIPPQCLDSRVKQTGYMNSIVAKMEANVAGANEALILDVNGFVSEAPAANFLIVKGGAVLSPRTVNILNGITRQTLLALALEAGYRVEEKDITLGDVFTADEAMVCGTGAEIVPVREVDGRRIGKAAPGPVTCRLIDAFHSLVKREGIPIYGSRSFEENK